MAGYVRAVADTVGVPVEGTGFEVSDTVTAYLGLSRQWTERPGRDLMLAWNEHHGWYVAVETDPAEDPLVVAYLGGDDPVPAPPEVARFVTQVIAEHHPDRHRPDFATAVERDELTRRLIRYAAGPTA